MKLIFPLLALMSVLVMPAKAQEAPAAFQPPKLFEEPLPTWSSAGGVAYPNGVTYLPDITYKSVTGYRPLKLDLYLPKKSSGNKPLVLWVHGGGFELGNPRGDWTYGDWRKVLAELSARGYAVAGVTYRLSSEAVHPAQLQDVQDALRFLRKNASLWQIQQDRVVAWGLSAGGALVGLLGAPCTDASICVQGVVDWFGPTDLTGLGNADAVRKWLGCGAQPCSDAALRSGSSALLVGADSPPFVIMQGGADPLVLPQQSQTLADALNRAGVANKLIVYPGLGHGFDGGSPDKLREILVTTFNEIERLARGDK